MLTADIPATTGTGIYNVLSNSKIHLT